MAQHARPKNRRATFTRTVALGTLTASAAVLAAGASASAAGPVSQSEGRFLSGSALGVNLSSIVSVDPATATNNGTKATVVDANPLSITALNAVNVDIGPVNLLGNNGILSLGAVGQYARAKSDGSSLAASGAVTNSGAIAVGGTNGVPAANATLDLTELLGGGAAGLISALEVEVGALSARATQAKGKNGVQAGTYQIADLELELTSPAVADVLDTLRTTLAGLQGTLDGLDETLETLLVVPLVDVTVPTLTDVVDALTEVSTLDGGLTVNLQDGTIRIDLEKILDALDLDLSHLPANTELLPYVLDALTDDLPGLLTGALDDLTGDLTDALDGIEAEILNIPIDTGVLDGAVAALLGPITDAVDDAATAIDISLDNDIADILSDLVSLRANVKASAGGTFTQRALRVGVADAAVVNLASASVGPNGGPRAIPRPTITLPVYDSKTTDTTPTIAGKGKAGLTVTVVEGSTEICDAKVKADNTWTCLPDDDMALGKHRITATQAETLGGVTRHSAESDPDRFTIIAEAVDIDTLPETGAGDAVPTAAAGLALLLGGVGLVAAPRLAGRTGESRAGGGRHARR